MDAVQYIREPSAKVMDAIKFIEERNRMCKSTNPSGCRGCPAFLDPCGCAVGLGSTVDATDQIAMVEKWSAAHPRKTRQAAFLEQWPNAPICNGVIDIAPCVLDKTVKVRNPCKKRCYECAQEFWSQEVK